MSRLISGLDVFLGTGGVPALVVSEPRARVPARVVRRGAGCADVTKSTPRQEAGSSPSSSSAPPLPVYTALEIDRKAQGNRASESGKNRPAGQQQLSGMLLQCLLSLYLPHWKKRIPDGHERTKKCRRNQRLLVMEVD
ncbi:hypothetical protein EYF80_032824 [Liparis tanakae]|uniref:Uncharacterized protein n=1 Tax=Liparis tanakae TaxID=230148 RepID=A0A4Z2GW68_9TELE|nr:hypothetical protein EYF80_032824 [Liparis tanakae]